MGLLGAAGTASATEVTFRRTFLDAGGDPIVGAFVTLETSGTFELFLTDQDGEIETTVSSDADWATLNFYNVSTQLDGVPDVQRLEIEDGIADEGTDSDVFRLPKPYRLQVRAVCGDGTVGVEGAKIHVGMYDDEGSLQGRSFTGPFTTTDDGYLQIDGADFTGFEMVGKTALKLESGPNAGTERRLTVTEDTTVEFDYGDCPRIEADVDVKPCSDPGAINPRSKGVIPVAIRHTDEFDPVERVDVSTLRFGAPEAVDDGAGAAPAHDGHVEDVVPCDGDGVDDLLVHFPTRDAGFDGDERQGKLVGETHDGTPVFGTDSVTLVGGGNGNGNGSGTP
jgi:hypothetical protein